MCRLVRDGIGGLLFVVVLMLRMRMGNGGIAVGIETLLLMEKKKKG